MWALTFSILDFQSLGVAPRLMCEHDALIEYVAHALCLVHFRGIASALWRWGQHGYRRTGVCVANYIVGIWRSV